MRITKDILYSHIRDESHKIDLYLPDDAPSCLLVYFHGGGLVEGSRDLAPMINFASDMTDAGIGIAGVEYRLYPEARYPDFIEDAAEAVAYIKRNIMKEISCDKLFLAGTSAGAYLTMMLCFDGRWLGKYKMSAEDIDGFIHDAGQPTVHFNVLRERGLDHKRIIIDESAPLYHIDRGDYPPMQFIVSDNDMHGRVEQTDLVVSTLLHFGYDGGKLTYTKTHGTHVWYVTKTDENGKNEFSKLILPFINKHI